MLSQYDTKAFDFLRTHTAPFRKFQEPFLCWVGKSRYYALDESCYMTFWYGDEGGCTLLCVLDLTVLRLYMIIFFYHVAEMDLFALIRHSDPTKVRVEERERLWKGEGSGDSVDKLFDEGDDAGQEHSIERDNDVLFQYQGKSLATICGLVPDGSSVSSGVTEAPVVVSVTHTPDDGFTNSVSRLNFLTCPPSLRSLAADVPITTVTFTTNVTAYASAVSSPKYLDSETMHRIYVLKWIVTNDFVLDDPYVCRELTDRLAPPALFLQLRAIDYDQLYNEFNVRAAPHVYLWAEVKMRAENTLEQKDRLEDKYFEQTALLSKRDTEIAHLKSLLSLKDAEAAEAIRLRGEKDVLFEKVKTLESAAALKETELAPLTAQVVQLTSDLSGFQLSKVASLESKRDSLVDQRSSLEYAFELFRERMEAMKDEQAKVLGSRVAELDAQLLEMAVHLEEEFYPHFLTTISGRRWILTHELKLILFKLLQDLSVIEAYDPFAEAKYVDVVSALRTMDFSLLSVLKSKKDASIVDLMDSHRLEGPLAEIPGPEGLQPSMEQLFLPIHRPEDNLVLGESSLSFSLQVVHSRVQRSLIGEASTTAIPTTAEPDTILL
uniref:Transposase (Putative), gypsy type n=1 Tax=Tanacetum cinerariifolium TaxID=118510 RepID=A0A6L2LYN0_TANCI|nr:hypothetical protein [Tanacetum cinerariifolium]